MSLRAERLKRQAGIAAGERRCIVTGVVAPRARLVRFVAGPDRTVVPDLDERLPGRGMWVVADAKVLAQAGGRFARALRGPVDVPEDLVARVESGLAARCRSLLGLARKAGSAVCGYEKVRSSVKAGAARLLLAASDGAEGGRSKLRALAHDVPVADGLTAAEIGAAFGRDMTVHAAITDAALASRLHRECTRLAGLRAGVRPASRPAALVETD